MKRRIIIGLCAVIILACSGVYAYGLYQHRDDSMATVIVSGEERYHFDLDTVTATTTYTVGAPGAQNVIEVSPRGIAVIHADCPDQTCVKQGRRQHGPNPIVCLPHELSIRFSSKSDATVDATTGT